MHIRAETPAQLCPVGARLGVYIFINIYPTRATVQGGVLAARLLRFFIRAPCAGHKGSQDATCPYRRGTRIKPIAFAGRKETAMQDNNLQPYTVEQLQQEYAVSLHVAVEVLEHFRGDRSKIDKFMKRCPHRDENDRQ